MKQISLLITLSVLSYGFWLSKEFKGLSAGVAIFLLGMLFLEQGFKTFTGGILERILEKTTNTRIKSLGFGIVSTTLMQSSSLVSIITISFLSAGLLNLATGIGIIFGANLGTTTGSWLIAGLGLKINISEYALPMLVFGILFIYQGKKEIKGIGYISAGLGFLFLGIDFMKVNFESFKSTLNLVDYAMPGIKGLLIFTVLGISATVIMQSSHATMVLIITALAAQQITYENALALAIGSNIGTTITAIMGAIGANIEGKRLAAAHLFFNLITGLLALLLIQQFVQIVDNISAWFNLSETDSTIKLAIFHSVFNLTGVVLLFPFIDQMVRLVEKLLPSQRRNVFQPEFLNDAATAFPETLIESAHLESIHLYENAVHIILKTFGLHRRNLKDQDALWDAISAKRSIVAYDIDASYEKRIKGIYSALISYISQANFSRQTENSARLYWLRGACRGIVDAIKDIKHLQKNWLRYGTSRNPSVQVAYKKICYQIILLVQQIELFRQATPDELTLLSLDSLKAQIEADDRLITHQIELLIWEKAITPENGSSLINDIAYMYSIKNNLITAAETLFINKELLADQTALQLTLNDSEIKEIIENLDQKTPLDAAMKSSSAP